MHFDWRHTKCIICTYTAVRSLTFTCRPPPGRYWRLYALSTNFGTPLSSSRTWHAPRALFFYSRSRMLSLFYSYATRAVVVVKRRQTSWWLYELFTFLVAASLLSSNCCLMQWMRFFFLVASWQLWKCVDSQLHCIKALFLLKVLFQVIENVIRAINIVLYH